MTAIEIAGHPSGGALGKIVAASRRPVDGASLAAFRIIFGALMMIAVVRFFVHGWIDDYFATPRYFFHHTGLAWVRPWPGVGMTVHFVAMGASAFFLTIGLWTRVSAASFGILFAYVHLIDKTNYLNHHYLIICLAFLLTCLPVAAVWSVDAWRRQTWRQTEIAAWALWAVRAQIGIVYVFGGIAKLGSDWLIEAQPMSIWLSASTDFPVIGGLFEQRWMAYAFSIAGAVFDLSIVGFLLWRRSRGLALVAVMVFHVMTARLFPLGMFPFLMMGASLVFLPADWPRRVFRVSSRMRGAAPATAAPADGRPTRRRRPVVLLPWLLSSFFALQILAPFRHLAYPGDTLWTEQGFRYSWKVMLMEKNGTAEFRVREPATGRSWTVSPRRYLTPQQNRMMATQPDMILQMAHVLADDFRARGIHQPEVRADVFVSLNGRPRARLVDSDVDLAQERDALGPKRWILPLPGHAQGPVGEPVRVVTAAGRQTR